jgi:hypothetical protein
LVDAALASTDWEIVVAGRDLARTRAFAAAKGSRVEAVALDARRCSAADLAATRAQIVVDAAGPFQTADYGLVLAAAEAKLHYIDIADARDFVAGFADSVGPAALRAAIVALAGASSTPSLSNAALDEITAGWREIEDILVVISPGNRAPRGLSVVRAILSYAGRPVRVFMGGRWVEAPGWGLTRRVELPGLGKRWASLCDTPDLDILPARFAVTSAALFLAGLELPILHLGLTAASMAVRRRLVPGLARLASFARIAAEALLPFGTDRGGMLVKASGVDGEGRRVRARWSLVAEGGEGPSIPILPALAALRAIAAGRLREPGARICVGILSLADIEAEFAGRRIAATLSREDRPQLFPAALGASFEKLPSAVAALHRPGRISVWRGRADVERGGGALARLAAWAFHLPRAGRDVPVTVTIEADEAGEVWTRVFGERSFHSAMRPGRERGEIEERFGPFSFSLALTPDKHGVAMRVAGWRLGPVPMPRFLAIRTVATETADAEGRFRFDVLLELPLGLGRVVRYAGWLSPAP